MNDRSQGGGRFGSFLLGFVAALVVLFVGVFAYFKVGHPPVATADPSFPLEAQIVHVPLDARIKRELQTPPFEVNEAVLQAGAHLYVAQCASCHGTPGHDVPYAKYMFPKTPQLWQKHGNGVVGVSDDETGETYWKIDNGIRLSGMPAYQKLLSQEQMWQIALLLKNADKPLSPEVQTTLQTTTAR